MYMRELHLQDDLYQGPTYTHDCGSIFGVVFSSLKRLYLGCLRHPSYALCFEVYDSKATLDCRFLGREEKGSFLVWSTVSSLEDPDNLTRLLILHCKLESTCVLHRSVNLVH